MEKRIFIRVYQVTLSLVFGYFLCASMLFSKLTWGMKPIVWPSNWDFYLPLSVYLLVLITWWAKKESSVVISLLSALLSVFCWGSLMYDLSHQAIQLLTFD